MRRPGGYLQIIDPEGPQIEHDTFTCCHCNKVVIVEHKTSGGRPATDFDFCRQCMKPVCPACSGKGCTPFEKRLDQYEKRQRLLASILR